VTLDDRTVKVLSREDYHYYVLSPTSEESRAEVWVSPMCRMSRTEIAAQLRRLATFVESL